MCFSHPYQSAVGIQIQSNVIHVIHLILFRFRRRVYSLQTSQMFNHRLLAARNAITVSIYFRECVKLIGISPGLVLDIYFEFYCCYFISDLSLSVCCGYGVLCCAFMCLF